MRNFARALILAIPFWPSIVMATACSFAVAALWGANIGAFYPILEVTINGKSMHAWIDEEIERYESSIHALREQSIALVLKSEQVRDLHADQANAWDAKVAEIEEQISEEQSKLSSYERFAPFIRQWVPYDPFRTIAFLVAALIVSTLIKHFFLISNEVLVGRVALSISRTIRMQVFDKALSMDRGNYATYGTGGFTSSITHTTDMLTNGLMSTLGAALREPLKVVACLAGAGLICWRLLLLSIVVAPVVGVMLYMITRRLRDVSRNQLNKAQNYHSVMLEALGNINTVQTFQMEHRESARFGEATQAVRDFGLKFVFYTSLSKPVIEFLGLGMLGTTIVGGAYLVLNQETQLLGIPVCDEPLSVSALLVFFGMLIGVSDPLRKLSAVYSSIYAGCIAADGLYAMLDHANKIADPQRPKTTPTPHRVVNLNDVTFEYSPNHPVLKNVELEIPFGSTVAIVGHNGSGKSTLIHLLCRFYDPCQGSLTLDGVDIRDMTLKDVRKRIALVNQHTELFDDTVANNIRYGRPEASDAEVEHAARQAHAHEFITTVLPGGYGGKVGQNGCNLSGGQRQRIALARALICNPEILILDEATSQIDMRSEQLIRESLAEHLGERTMIIITHREKLLELADRVYEVHDGLLVDVKTARNAA